MLRPWKVTVEMGAERLTRSFGSGEAAFDAADVLRQVVPAVRVKNTTTGEIWSWDEGRRSQTPGN